MRTTLKVLLANTMLGGLLTGPSVAHAAERVTVTSVEVEQPSLAFDSTPNRYRKLVVDTLNEAGQPARLPYSLTGGVDADRRIAARIVDVRWASRALYEVEVTLRWEHADAEGALSTTTTVGHASARFRHSDLEGVAEAAMEQATQAYRETGPLGSSAPQANTVSSFGEWRVAAIQRRQLRAFTGGGLLLVAGGIMIASTVDYYRDTPRMDEDDWQILQATNAGGWVVAGAGAGMVTWGLLGADSLPTEP